MDIKDFELTEDDFVLIMEALEFLPQREPGGGMMGFILATVLPDDPAVQAKAEAMIRAKEKERTLKKEALVEDIRILQGKLLSIKRALLQAGALKQATDALKPKS